MDEGSEKPHISKELQLFYSEFLNAHTWLQRKDGPSLEYIDALNEADLKTAEQELIKAVDIKDRLPLDGLEHIKSKAALPKLYKLLEDEKCTDYMRFAIARGIYIIGGDEDMTEIAIGAARSLQKQQPLTDFQLIDVCHMLKDFKSSKVTDFLNELCNSNRYLVAYNAAAALGKSTEDIVEKFREKK